MFFIGVSTRLGIDDVTNDAIHELEQMPEPKMSRVFIDFIQAMSYIAQGKAQEGLDLIDVNLDSVFMEREEFRSWKYKHLAYKGSAHVWLARLDDALRRAGTGLCTQMFPDGERETRYFDLINAQIAYWRSIDTTKHMLPLVKCSAAATERWLHWPCKIWLNVGCGNRECPKRWSYT